MSTPEQPDTEWIAIARIMRTQGRKGEVLAELLTDQTDEFRAGRNVRLQKHGKEGVEGVLEDHWMPMGKNAGRIVLKLQGYDTISQAEALAGTDVAIPAAELPELEADTFYVRDLIGCVLVDNGREVGLVIDVQFATSPDGKVRLEDAAPLLAVEEKEDAEPVLVPLVRAYLRSVDVAAKRITMELPPGLLDLAEEADGDGEGDDPDAEDED